MSVIDQARELGISLASSPEFMRMKQAQAALTEDETVSNLLEELNQKKQELIVSLSEDSPNTFAAVSLSNDIDRLSGQLKENPIFSELVDSENAFSTLIMAVDAEINACIGGESTISHEGIYSDCLQRICIG